MSIPTPHNTAKKGDIAKKVLMPGDPLRAKYIAETYLENPVCFNTVRNMFGYTGTYKGQQVSVMGGGMGMPSMAIYSYELFKFFNVKNIIRIGSAGSINQNIKVRDIVIGMGACTNSNYASQYGLSGTFAPICSYKLLRTCTETATELGLEFKVGNLYSSDTFYDDSASTAEWAKMGVMAVEMESAALYMNAARLGKDALAICTVSDHILTGEATTAEERQTSFTDMMRMALETAVRL